MFRYLPIYYPVDYRGRGAAGWGTAVCGPIGHGEARTKSRRRGVIRNGSRNCSSSASRRGPAQFETGIMTRQGESESVCKLTHYRPGRIQTPIASLRSRRGEWRSATAARSATATQSATAARSAREARSGGGGTPQCAMCAPRRRGPRSYGEGARRRGRFSTGGLGAPASRSWSLRKIMELMS